MEVWWSMIFAAYCGGKWGGGLWRLSVKAVREMVLKVVSPNQAAHRWSDGSGYEKKRGNRE